MCAFERVIYRWLVVIARVNIYFIDIPSVFIFIFIFTFEIFTSTCQLQYKELIIKFI